MKDGLTIGQLSARCGVSRDTLRYWERERLLPAPRRSRAGYRLYEPEHEARARFVRQAQALGLSLEDVRELLELRRLGSPRECERVAARLAARVAQIDARMAELRQLRRRLRESLRRCEAAGRGECPVSLDLGSPGGAPEPRRPRRPRPPERTSSSGR